MSLSKRMAWVLDSRDEWLTTARRICATGDGSGECWQQSKALAWWLSARGGLGAGLACWDEYEDGGGESLRTILARGMP